MIAFKKKSYAEIIKAKKGEIGGENIFFGLSDHSANRKKGIEKVSLTGLSFRQMKQIYFANPWVQICVNKIVNRTVNFSPIVRPVNSDNVDDSVKKNIEIVNEWFIRPNTNGQSLDSVRKQLHRDVLIYDAGVIEKVIGKKVTSNESRNLIEVYNLPGNTIRPNPNKRGQFPRDNTAYFQISRDSKINAQWRREEIMYHVNNPMADQVFGVSPLEVLVQTVKADLDAAEHNAVFFQNNATPRFAVMFNDAGLGQGSPTIRRFREYWDQELRGNPHRPMIMSSEKGNISFQRVSMSADEMQFQEYSRWLLQKIMSVYNVPALIIGVLDTNMGKLNSEQQTILFKEDAIKPQLKLFANRWNRDIIFDDSAFGFDNVFIDFDLDLVDSDNRSRTHERYLRNGVITINDVREELGLQDVAWGNIPYLQNNLQAFGDDGRPLDQSGNPIDTTSPNNNNVARSFRRAIFDGTQPHSDLPVGWETFEPGERWRIVEKILKNREATLSKAYSFARNTHVVVRDNEKN